MGSGNKLARLAAGGLVLALTACGSDTVTNHEPPPPTPAPPPRVVAEGAGVSLPVEYAIGTYFDLSATGTIEATVDHTYADTLLALWIAKGRCASDQFGNGQCQYVVTSFGGSKPRKVSVTGQPAGAYTLIVWNGGVKDESVSYQVVFTQTATAGTGEVSASGKTGAEPGFKLRLPSPPGTQR